MIISYYNTTKNLKKESISAYILLWYTSEKKNDHVKLWNNKINIYNSIFSSLIKNIRYTYRYLSTYIADFYFFIRDIATNFY